MHPDDIRALDASEIEDAIENARKELFNLRFKKASGQLADTSRVRIARRDLARLNTIRREREILAAWQAAQAEE